MKATGNTKSIIICVNNWKTIQNFNKTKRFIKSKLPRNDEFKENFWNWTFVKIFHDIL